MAGLEERLAELSIFARVLRNAKPTLAVAQANAVGAPQRYAAQDIEYGIYTLEQFRSQLELLSKRGFDLWNAKGRGRIAVQLPFNTPISGFALSFASSYLFPDNVVEVKFPSICQPVFAALVEAMESDVRQLTRNSNGASIFSNEAGPLFLAKQIEGGAAVVQTYGHPKMLTPTLISKLRRSRSAFILEGPGNNPSIVAETADLSRAAKTVAALRTSNSGQVCMGTETTYVHESVKDAFLDRLYTELDRTLLGEVDDERAQVTPVQTTIAKDAQSLLESAIASGSRVLYARGPTGSQATARFEPSESTARRTWVPLTVVDVPDDSAITQREKFCPVLPIRTYRTDEDLIEELSNKRYFLAATFYGDVQQHPSLVDFLEQNYGNLFANRNTFDTEEGFDVLRDPWGGYGDSRFRLEPRVRPDGRREFARIEGPSYLLTEFSTVA